MSVLPPMQYRRLGRTGLQVSAIGLGTGGPSMLGQRSGVAQSEAERTVRHALDLGINLIDTAADYQGSEAILGAALEGVPRDSYILCTKFKAERRVRHADGTTHDELKPPDEMVASLERSLKHLGTDYVDVFQIHGVPAGLYEQIRDAFVPVARRLQTEGKCRFLGITDAFSDQDGRTQLVRATQDDDFDTLMVGYNLMTPGPETDILPAAAASDRGVIIMCAVRRAIARPEQLEALIAQLKAAGELPRDGLPDQAPLDWLAHDDVESVVTAAYKFAAAHPAVSCVLTGTASIEHLEQNIVAVLGPPLPAADRQRLLSLFGPIGRKLGN
jgi:aryl-alcohol dehydrogenase-like predicted oxidoreductase